MDAIGPGNVVQRKPGGGAVAAQGSTADRLVHLLSTTQQRRDEQTDAVYALLASLDLPDMLAAMSSAAERGYLSSLMARSNAAAWYERSRILAALYAVELARAPTTSATDDRLRRAATALDELPQGQQFAVLEYLLRRSRVGADAAALLEGVLAMREQQGAQPDASPPSEAGAGGGSRAPEPHLIPAGMGAVGGASMPDIPANVPQPVEPGPWAPPGKQPIPFYIGNEAHRGIADAYRAAHGADVVRSNTSPISSILTALIGLGHSANPGALSETERGLMPDIVNLTRRHLYEIKPVAAQALGAAKAGLELGLFGRAGVAMRLGPVGEPGTSGGLQAPDGVYMFWVAQPGVIVYQYRKGRLVPVPIPWPEGAKERRWRFELQPMTAQQKQMVATLTVGTALLLIAMILLSPVGI